MIHSICEFKTKPFLSRVPIFTDPERTVPMGFHRDPRTSPWQPLTLNVSTCFLGCFLQCPSIQVNGMRPKTSSDEAIVLGANLIQSRNTILKVWPDIEKAKDLESNSTHSIQINTRQARIFSERPSLEYTALWCLNSQTDIHAVAIDFFLWNKNAYRKRLPGSCYK